MDAINLDILKQLQEYAQMYFDAIVEANSECGKCKFANGKYTAKDVTKWIYALPCDDIFNEDIILESGTFKCKFPYRRIFEVLSDWETMCRAGKLKTLFEIGEDEVKSAKVLTQEKTVLGAFKTKSMKLQHIGGNWWGLPKEIRKGNAIIGYYELNGVMFAPGKTFWGDVASAGNQEFCKNRDDADIIKLIKSYIGQHCSENPYCEYITEVARLAGISNKPDQAATPTETPRISTETAETVNVSAEEGKREYYREYRLTNDIPLFSGDPEITEQKWLIGFIHSYGNFRVEVAYIFMRNGKLYEDIMYLTKEQFRAKYGQFLPSVNVSAEGEKEAERANVKDMKRHYDAVAPAYYKHTLYKFNEYLYAFGKDAELLKEFFSNNRWIELKWVEHNLNGANYLRFHYSHMDAIKDFLKKKLNLDNILIGVWDSEEVWHWSKQNSPSQPPQSPEAPQSIKRTTDTPKPRGTARKRQNRAAGCAQRARRSGLGTNGYSMLDYASAMLAAMNVPRKCSTELSPPGYVPPIRGDCTTYKRPTNDHITDLKPP